MSATSLTVTESLTADSCSMVRERTFRFDGFDWPSAVVSILDLLRREKATGHCKVHLIHGTATTIQFEERQRLAASPTK